MPDALSFSTLFGTTRDTADMVSIAINAVRRGYAVVPVKPDSKRPACTLTARQRTQADRAAAEEAKARGKRNWQHARHECGSNHAITDEKEAARVFKRMFEAEPNLNLAIEVGRSRVITVDCDNREDVVAFTRMWADTVGVPELANIQPTVSSPGVVKDRDGEDEVWTHKNGGHFHFILPEDVDFSDAATSNGMEIGNSKAVVYFKDRIVLVPPSVREEGPYTLQSDIGPAPRWLIEAVQNWLDGHLVRAERQRTKALEGDDPIDAWAASFTWAELLEADDWTSMHKFDSCGCELWTRPGAWSNPKSAVAHEPGCTRWEFDSHGFLHLYTDDPPDFLRRYVDERGSKSLSKLHYIAYRDFDGDFAAAMREMNIGTLSEKLDPADLIAPGQEVVVADPKDIEQVIEEKRAEESEDHPLGLRARMYTRSQLKLIPPPTWLIKDWLTTDSLARISGSPGSWKSFVALDMACCVATGHEYHGHRVDVGRVLYIAGEGVAGTGKRIDAWELENGVTVPDERFTLLAGPVNAASLDEWAELCAVNSTDVYDLIILDTQARMTAGLDENDNSEMSAFLARLDLLRRESGATVLVVHHSGHGQGRGRGASSMWGGMDVELFLDRDRKAGTSKLGFIKSKDNPEDLEIVFTSKEYELGTNEEGETIKSIVLQPYTIPVEEQGIEFWINVLDSLGIPRTAGHPKCSEALRLAGYHFDDKVLREVIRERKKRSDVPENGSGNPDDGDGEQAEGAA